MSQFEISMSQSVFSLLFGPRPQKAWKNTIRIINQIHPDDSNNNRQYKHRLLPPTAEKMVSRSVVFIVPHPYSQAQVKKLIISEGSYEAIRNHRGTINRIFTICSGALNLFLSPRTIKYPSSPGFFSLLVIIRLKPPSVDARCERRETATMKVFLILALCLASSQGLFLRHFQNKWDTISGWWAGGEEEPQPQLTETLGETEDSEIILPERQYKDDTSYYYETTSTSSTISTSTSTTTTAAETTTVTTTVSTTNPTESSTVKGRSRNPRCRTVDSRVGHCTLFYHFLNT